MTVSFLKTSKHYNIDPEEVWKLVIELGSFDKVALHLADKGVVNEKTGKAYNPFIVQRACWKWIIENPKISLEMLREKEPQITDEYWEQFLISKAYTTFVTLGHNRKKFDNWILKNGFEKYLDYRRSPHFKQEGDI